MSKSYMARLPGVHVVSKCYMARLPGVHVVFKYYMARLPGGHVVSKYNMARLPGVHVVSKCYMALVAACEVFDVLCLSKRRVVHPYTLIIKHATAQLAHLTMVYFCSGK